MMQIIRIDEQTWSIENEFVRCFLLEVIHLPGHTPGSIALLDKNRRILFSGDPIQDGEIFMFGIHRDMDAYLESLKRLQNRISDFDSIYPSHGTMPVTKELIGQLIDGAKKVVNDEIPWVKADRFPVPVRAYHTGTATFLMPE